MTTTASQITSLTVVYSTVYSDADQRKHQSSASLAFVRGFHRYRWIPRTTGPVTRKMFPFDDVIMHWECIAMVSSHKYLCYPCCVVPSMTSLAVCFSYMHEWKLAVWSMNSNEQRGALLPNWAHCIGDSQSNIGVYCCINSIIGCWMLFRYVWN